jgi:hypothetical protein
MTLKGYGFATNANGPIKCVPVDAPDKDIVTGIVAEDDEEKDPLEGYVRPERLPSVLMIGPEDWTVSGLQFIQDYLAREGIIAKTFRPDDLSIDDVLAAMKNTQGVILATGVGPNAWGNRYRFRIKQAADELSIPLIIMSQGSVAPVQAADKALTILR